MNSPAIVRITALLFMASLSTGVVADEWSDAGFTAMHRVVWLDAGYTLREAKRWKSRCGITDPAQVAAWESIGLNTPTAVSLWINKGYTTPESVVKFRNGETLDSTSPQPTVKESQASSRTLSERKKREWLKKSQIEELIASGVDGRQAEEWIYAGYSSDETLGWLKVAGIRLPDDLLKWLDIGIETPEVLLEWHARGLTTPAAVQKQMDYKKSEQEKFKRLGISPARAEEWSRIGARTFNQVNYLVNRGYSIEELRGWMAAGFNKLNDIELWREVELPPEEASRWRAAGFGADEAAQLRVAKFSLTEIISWQDIFGPYRSTQNNINSWRSAGFEPAEAGRWIRAHPGIGAETARAWQQADYQPGSEWLLLESSPAEVELWRKGGFSATETVSWIKGGFSVATAQPWQERGLNARQAREWQGRDYTPAAAELWLGHGVERPERAARLKEVTIDVSDFFTKGVTYNSFRKTAKLLDIHNLPNKLDPQGISKREGSSHFDTLTPFAKCMTAYAKKMSLSESAVNDIERAYFYQSGMKEAEAKRFMQQYRDSCEDWTRYIFTIWLKARN